MCFWNALFDISALVVVFLFHIYFIYFTISIFRIPYTLFWAILVYLCIKDDTKRSSTSFFSSSENRAKPIMVNRLLSLPVFQPISKLSFQLYLLHCMLLTVTSYQKEGDQFHTVDDFVSKYDEMVWVFSFQFFFFLKLDLKSYDTDWEINIVSRCGSLNNRNAVQQILGTNF